MSQVRHKWSFREWLAKRVAPKNMPILPSLSQDVKEELELIQRDLLLKELDAIDEQHVIMAHRAKCALLAKWAQSLATDPLAIPANET